MPYPHSSARAFAGDELSMSLTPDERGRSPFAIEAAMHTYRRGS